MHVARRLREARAGLGLNQADLAARLGFTQAAISLWEGEHRRPGIVELDELASALEKPLAYFLDWDAG
jgi:transcriptional regulator with XRE-family HTH domain